MSLAEAYAAGYAVHGELPMDHRTLERARLLLVCAEDLPDQEGRLTFVGETALYDGLKAKCAARRKALSAKWVSELADFMPDVAKAFPAEAYIEAVLRALRRTEEAQTEKEKRKSTAKKLAVLAFLHLLQTDANLQGNWYELVASARAAAIAEGITEANALTAAARGDEPPDLDDLFDRALYTMTNLSGQFRAQSAAWVKDEVDGLGGDLSVAVSNALEGGESADSITGLVGGAITAGRGAVFYLDESIHTAEQAASLRQYGDLAVALVDYNAVDDERTCQACEDNEAGSPYPLDSAPEIPFHGGCRCWYSPAV